MIFIYIYINALVRDNRSASCEKRIILWSKFLSSFFHALNYSLKIYLVNLYFSLVKKRTFFFTGCLGRRIRI